MKKLYFFLGFLALVFASCTKEYIPANNGKQTILLSVPSQAWRTTDGIDYTASLYVPEITNYFNETGEVSVYISYGNGIYEQIPEVKGNIAFSFSHRPGNLTLYAQDLNESGIIPPDNTTVKVILVSSDY